MPFDEPNVWDDLVKRGEDFVLPIDWKAGLPLPAAVDLRGATARLDIRASYQDTVPLLTLTSSPAAGIVIDPLAGGITFTITEAQLAAIAASITEVVYDLKVTFADASDWPLLQGRLTLMPTGNP